MTAAVVALVVLLAAANGSNDDPKGVATLGGAGIASYRRALVWGVVATFAGALLSLHLASGLTKLFSTGIVTTQPGPGFALSVLVGATVWVAFATVARLPVSTTHAIVGAIVGAGLVQGADTVAWGALLPKVAEPLLLSVAVAYLLSLALSLLPARTPECVCVQLEHQPVAAVELAGSRTSTLTTRRLPVVETGTVEQCHAHGLVGGGVAVTVNGLHWASAGAASFARGLNDTPKIVAVAAVTTTAAGLRTSHLVVVVAAAMALGGLVGGLRVARRLGDDMVAMDPVEGARANLASAALVGLGATQGLPLSLTHVSSGAIAGTAGLRRGRLHPRTLRDFAIAWTVTPFVAGAVAAVTFALVV